jgi:hypothetical protein
LDLTIYDSDIPKPVNARLVLEAFDCISKHVWDGKIQYTGRDWTTLIHAMVSIFQRWDRIVIIRVISEVTA